ncbi:3-hydroxyacyl-ACP dehydratase FabZ [Candidatus Bipolaricaulota bacterium]|nr:3-hydroxyacyl-ACP dehydratase FabZ [Candidatus Bipolaricaulota bacterium]
MERIEAIRKRIPTRYPYLMVDRVIEESATVVVAVKNVTINEPFFQGHFPEPMAPIMPGTLILEAMAQVSGLFASQDGREGYLVGVDRAKFRRKVVPGDQLIVRAVLVRRKAALIQTDVEARVRSSCMEGEASTEDELAASARISLMAP